MRAEHLQAIEALVSQGPAVCFVWRADTDFSAEYVSPSIRQFGYEPEDFTSGRLTWPGLTHPEDDERLRDEVETYLATGQSSFAQQYRIYDSRRDLRWINDWNRVVRDDRKRVRAIHGLVLDVTHHVETRQALREREAMFERAERAGRVGSWTLDTESGRLSLSKNLCALCGLDDSLPYYTLSTVMACIHPEDRQRISDAVRAAMETGATRPVDFRVVWPDGTVRYMNASSEVRRGPDGTIASFGGMVQDVTASRVLERAVLEAERREQERIGRDLHDSLGQELAGLGYLAAALAGRVNRACPDAAREARRIREVASEATAHVRQIAQGLLPVGIETGGFNAALERLSRIVREIHGKACDIDLRVAADFPFHLEVATHLYLIAREAVGNAVAHGNCKGVLISLFRGDGRVTLRIDDDGDGIGPDADKAPGLGLRIMRYRAQMVGGELWVGQRDGRGTRVMCTLAETTATRSSSGDATRAKRGSAPSSSGVH